MSAIILRQIFGHNEIHNQSLYLYFHELSVHKIGIILTRNIESYDGAIKIAQKRLRLDKYYTYNQKYFKRP